MKLYLGGKMCGVTGYGFSDFNSDAKQLRAQGHIVFNPAEHDINTGFNPAPDEIKTSYADLAATGFDRNAALLIDVTWILTESEGMVVRGTPESYGSSPGTKLEIAAHQSIFLPIWEFDDFMKFGHTAPMLNPMIVDGKVVQYQ